MPILFDNNCDEKAAIEHCKAKKKHFVVTPFFLSENRREESCERILKAGVSLLLVNIEHDGRCGIGIVNKLTQDPNELEKLKKAWSSGRNFYHEDAKFFHGLFKDEKIRVRLEETPSYISELENLHPKYPDSSIHRNFFDALKMLNRWRLDHSNLGPTARKFWKQLGESRESCLNCVYDLEYLRILKQNTVRIRLCTNDRLLRSLAEERHLPTLDPSWLENDWFQNSL